MSLPDTIFIFVLALIIFGPKKLPEIGRQIGKLVGEFRRASNEFKFQIEEELRQVDFNEKRIERQTIAPPQGDSAQSDHSSQSDAHADPGASLELAETLPAGQHPNIDSLDLSTLERLDPNAENAGPVPQDLGNETAQQSIETPTVTAAAGSEPRSTIPYAHAEPYPPVPPVEAAVVNGKRDAERPDLSAHRSPGSAEPVAIEHDETPTEDHSGVHTSLESADVSRG